MATSFEELRVLREAEAVADGIWQEVSGWEPFAREVVGGQLARAADSIGANILTSLARQLNAFAGSLKAQRHSNTANQKAVREISAEYIAGAIDNTSVSLLTEAEIEWLQATEISNLQSPISNL